MMQRGAFLDNDCTFYYIMVMSVVFLQLRESGLIACLQNGVACCRLDSSGTVSMSGETVTLSRFFCHGENLFIQVETTAPPPKRRSRRAKKYRSATLRSQYVQVLRHVVNVCFSDIHVALVHCTCIYCKLACAVCAHASRHTSVKRVAVCL